MSEREALVEQIVRLLDIRLLDPLEVLLDGDDVVHALRGLIRIRAGHWADGLRTGDDATAVGTAIRLVATLYPDDRAFDPPAAWWQTPLGQVVARRVGHPAAESVSYATAGAMLGISRQGVHDLVRRGRLPRHPDGGVPTTAVRDRLRSGPPSTPHRPPPAPPPGTTDPPSAPPGTADLPSAPPGTTDPPPAPPSRAAGGSDIAFEEKP